MTDAAAAEIRRLRVRILEYEARAAVSNEPSLTGREFQREVADDPAKWAERFLAAYASTDHVRTDADRLEFVTQWFEDFRAAVLKAKPKPIMEERPDAV